jgi:hypothetical protein
MILLAAINLALSAFWYVRGRKQGYRTGRTAERNMTIRMLRDDYLRPNYDHPLARRAPKPAASTHIDERV